MLLYNEVQDIFRLQNLFFTILIQLDPVYQIQLLLLWAYFFKSWKNLNFDFPPRLKIFKNLSHSALVSRDAKRLTLQQTTRQIDRQQDSVSNAADARQSCYLSCYGGARMLLYTRVTFNNLQSANLHLAFVMISQKFQLQSKLAYVKVKWYRHMEIEMKGIESDKIQ